MERTSSRRVGVADTQGGALTAEASVQFGSVRITLRDIEDRSFVLYEAQAVTARPRARELMESARRAWTGWAASATQSMMRESGSRFPKNIMR